MFIKLMAFVVLIVCLAGVGAGLALFFGWHVLNNYLQERRKRHLIELALYHRRLAAVVNGLLSRADEIDQEQRYSAVLQAPELSRRLGKACSDLVVLGDSLPAIDSQIKSGEVRMARQLLLSSCRVAVKLSRELTAIQVSSRTLPTGRAEKHKEIPRS